MKLHQELLRIFFGADFLGRHGEKCKVKKKVGAVEDGKLMNYECYILDLPPTQ